MWPQIKKKEKLIETNHIIIWFNVQFMWIGGGQKIKLHEPILHPYSTISTVKYLFLFFKN